MNYTVVIMPDTMDGAPVWVAYVAEAPGIHTIDTSRARALDALELLLSHEEMSKHWKHIYVYNDDEHTKIAQFIADLAYGQRLDP